MVRNPLFHFIGAIVLLVLVCTGYALWFEVVQAKSQQVVTLSSEIQNKSQDSTRVALAKTELVTLDSDEATVEQYFVSTNNVVPFLEQLATTGSFLGSNVQVVSVSANPGTPYGELSLSLKITGTFNSVFKTLGAIEYGPYATKLTSLTISTSGVNSSGSTANWTAAAIFSIGTESSTINQDASPIPAPVATTTNSSAQATAQSTIATTTQIAGTTTPSVTP